MQNKKNDKKTIGIIFGGSSNEHDVSIESAKTIYSSLTESKNKNTYDVNVFYINKHGEWFSNEKSTLLLKNQKTHYELFNKKSFIHNKLNFLENIDFSKVEIWFPILHGLNGEDGTIHGLLKLTKKPIIGSGVLGSCLGMDKISMKTIFSQSNIPQVKYIQITNFDSDNNEFLNLKIKEIIDQLKFPIFIKPSNSGSSLGISRVTNKESILRALLKAAKIDSRIIIEEGLNVRELECGVIGNTKLETTVIGEVEYSSEWYDYESKYQSNSKIRIPAELDSDVKKKIKNLTVKACDLLDISGFARADFFLERSTNRIYLNEINTIPGFTEKSMFPMLWKASGLDIYQLVAKLVDMASDK